jgi:hypothetical protein
MVLMAGKTRENEQRHMALLFLDQEEGSVRSVSPAG